MPCVLIGAPQRADRQSGQGEKGDEGGALGLSRLQGWATTGSFDIRWCGPLAEIHGSRTQLHGWVPCARGWVGAAWFRRGVKLRWWWEGENCLGCLAYGWARYLRYCS